MTGESSTGAQPTSQPADPSQVPATPAQVPPPATKPEETVEHWKARHNEATDTIRKLSTENKRFKDTFGDLEEPTLPVTPTAPSASTQGFMTKEEFQEWTLDQQIARTPSLVEHNAEIKEYVKKGIEYDVARKIVAEKHNVTLGPSNPFEMMPTVPSGGSLPPDTSSYTQEQLDQMNQEGISPETAKKHEQRLTSIWTRALKKK